MISLVPSIEVGADSRRAVARVPDGTSLDQRPVDDTTLGVVKVPNLAERARLAPDDRSEAIRLCEGREDLGAGVCGVVGRDDAVRCEPIVRWEGLEGGDGALEVGDELALSISWDLAGRRKRDIRSREGQCSMPCRAKRYTFRACSIPDHQ